MKDKTSTLTHENLYQKYIVEKMSASEIAVEYGCDPKKITRALVKLNIPVRGKEEARQLYVEKYGHPRKGITLSDEVKEKISEKQSGNWTATRKEKQSKKISDKWKAGEYNPEILVKANEGLRRAAKEGSAQEKLIVDFLEGRGIKCITQSATIYENLNMKVDIWCPGSAIVIEVDGPCHLSPVFGEERLQKQILSDQEKNAHLLNKGLKVLRFKIWVKHMSQRHERKILEEFEKAFDMTMKFGGVQTWDYGKENEE